MAKNFNILMEKMPSEVRRRAEEKAQTLILKERLSESELITQEDLFRLENKIKNDKHEMIKYITGLSLLRQHLS